MTEPVSKREQILAKLADLLRCEQAGGWFPEPTVDEPEPRDWVKIPDSNLQHVVNVADGPVESLAFASSTDEPSENEVEAAIAYLVAGPDPKARRARRDAGVRRIAALVALDPTLGLGVQIYAEVQEPTRDDNIPIRHSHPVATAVVPITVLYPGADKAD